MNLKVDNQKQLAFGMLGLLQQQFRATCRYDRPQIKSHLKQATRGKLGEATKNCRQGGEIEQQPSVLMQARTDAWRWPSCPDEMQRYSESQRLACKKFAFYKCQAGTFSTFFSLSTWVCSLASCRAQVLPRSLRNGCTACCGASCEFEE